MTRKGVLFDLLIVNRGGLCKDLKSTMNCLKYCQRRMFPQDKLLYRNLSTEGKEEGVNTWPKRWRVRISTQNKILLCRLWEKHRWQQQEDGRPGEADLGNLSGQKFPHGKLRERRHVLFTHASPSCGNCIYTLRIPGTQKIQKKIFLWYKNASCSFPPCPLRSEGGLMRCCRKLGGGIFCLHTL